MRCAVPPRVDLVCLQAMQHLIDSHKLPERSQKLTSGAVNSLACPRNCPVAGSMQEMQPRLSCFAARYSGADAASAAASSSAEHAPHM